MTSRFNKGRARLGTAFVALAIGLGTVAAPTQAVAQWVRHVRQNR